MHIRYVINQHHCDKIKDFLMLMATCFFFLVTRIKNCLLYHAFNQHLGEINKKKFIKLNKIDL